MRYRSVRAGAFVLLALAVPAASQAAGIDCSKARSLTEKSICADPRLLALDGQVASAYADLLARQPDRKDALRADLLRWLKQRDTACALPTADIARCVGDQLATRLAALAPPPLASSPLASLPAASSTSTPPVAGRLQTASPATRPADPPVPSGAFPPGAAALDAATVPAAGRAETLLHVSAPGRFTVAAHSPFGAALQLVDIMDGPGDVSGAPGAQDGRLDALLDIGTYKLRVTSAKGAAGTVALAVTPFHDAAPPAALPPPGFPLAASLADGEQRAFWLDVPPDGAVRIEAAGRALADLRLWRDGRDLTALDPAATITEPTVGHPLNDLRLLGKVEPGTYLAVAYGGPALRWTDNDSSQPFLLRAGVSSALAEGWAGGPVGPFGSEVYALPAATGLLRLSLPVAAAAELRAGSDSAVLERRSREPSASLAVSPKATAIVELRAAAGQAFTLQALEQPGSRTLRAAGTFWVAAAANGAGGDELPPGVLLERTEGVGKPPRIVATTVPRVGPGSAWHARFNLRGETTLLVQNTAGGALGVHTAGVAVIDAHPGQVQDLPSDYYGLRLKPEDSALGSLDVTVGPPGASAALAAPLPPDPVIPLGVFTLQPGDALRLSGPTAPGLQLGLLSRRVPVALAEGPLTVTQAAGSTVAVPVTLAPGGTLAVSEVGGGPVPFGLQDAGGLQNVGSVQKGESTGTVVVPITDHPRTLVLAWRRTPTIQAAIPAPSPLGAVPALAAGAPAALDLARGETRGFALTVPEGGLYRVETLGRLRTAGRIATPFLPRLGEAEANGAGQNMLLQQILRAGRYRVDVTARDSAGHAQLAATPAPVLEGGTLAPGGSVRATLPAGTAIRFALQATGPGEQYRLEAASLGVPWQGRIEDADGWPMARTAALDGLAPTLPPGAYRLVVAPDAVDRQFVARLRSVVPEVPINGHGPHPLPFDSARAATWREPDGSHTVRTPDAWGFTLAGPAEVTLTLGKGMAGELRRDGDPAVLARVMDSYTGPLDAGQYRLDASSLGRNDRLDYTVALSSPALQPGVPRHVTLPGTVAFALAEARVASLTTFGSVPVKAVLRRAHGGVVARYGARADDWNIAASRLLPAGRYTLDLTDASPASLDPVSEHTAPSNDADAGDKPDDDDQPAQGAAMASDTPQGAAMASDTPSDQPTPATDGDAQPERSTELTLALPAALPGAPAPATMAALTGTGVHVLSLPQPAPGALVVAQASSIAPIVLALERKAAAGWDIVALDEGTAPAVAAPADAAAPPWRVETWTVDGGPEPVRLAARTVDAVAQAAGAVSLAALDGMPGTVAVARVTADAATPVSVTGPPDLLAGGWPGQALTPVHGPVLLGGRDVWLLGRAAGPVAVASLPLAGPQAITVPPGQVAQLPALPATAGHLALWRAAGAFGQPGLGAAAGIAPGSAVARADAPVTLRASGGGALRLSLTPLDLTLLPARTADGAMQATLPPTSALPLTLPGGGKTLQLDLGAGVAAFVGGTAAWAGDAPLSRTMAGAWTDILLVNTGAAAAPAAMRWQPAPAAAPLRPGTAVKRFFGAAGSFEAAFDAPPGARLAVAGDAQLTAIAADGAVSRGQDIAVAGAGRVLVAHGPGPVALWLAAEGASPWPEAASEPVQTPARLTLAGDAMVLALNPAQPGLLHVSTTAPVLAALVQAGRTDPPRLFPAGAELHAALSAGPAELRLYSPSDGPLTGRVTLALDPVTPIGEGLGAAVSVAPGGTAAWAFALAKAATVGVGVRAEPDRVSARLLDATGAVLGEGVALLRALPAGRYVIEARVPPDGAPAVLRPAVVGITPRGSGPPPDVVQDYLTLAGLKPQGTTP